MTIPAFPAFGLIKLLDHNEFALFVPCDHHLGDALTIVDYKVFLRQVYQADPEFAAIVGVNGTRRIENGYPMPQRQAATRPDLSLKPHGQSNIQARRNELALERTKHYRLVKIGANVHTGTLCRSIGGQSLMSLIDNFYLNHTKYNNVQK